MALAMMIERFQIAIAADEIDHLKRRIRLTRWLASMAEAGWALGMDLEFLRALADCWAALFRPQRGRCALSRAKHPGEIVVDDPT